MASVVRFHAPPLMSIWKGAILPTITKDCGGSADDVDAECVDGICTVTFRLGNTVLRYDIDEQVLEDWRAADYSTEFYNENIRRRPFPDPIGTPGWGNGRYTEEGG